MFQCKQVCLPEETVVTEVDEGFDPDTPPSYTFQLEDTADYEVGTKPFDYNADAAAVGYTRVG